MPYLETFDPSSRVQPVASGSAASTYSPQPEPDTVPVDFDEQMTAKLEQVKARGVPHNDALEIVKELKRLGKVDKAPSFGQTLTQKATELGQTLGGAAEKAKESFVEGSRNIGRNIQKGVSGEISPGSAAVRTVSSGVDVALSPFAGVIGQGVEEAAKVTPEPAKEAIVKKISEAKEMFSSLPSDQQERLNDIGAGLNILTAGIGVKAAPKAVSAIEGGIGRGAQAVKEAVPNVAKPLGEAAGDLKGGITRGIGRLGEKAADRAEKSAEELIFEAVNPTKLENKRIVRQRANDLKPYIEDTLNFTRNDLENVKARIDADKDAAAKSMRNYEEKVGVKGEVDIAPIVKKLETDYLKKVGDSFIDPDAARIANELIQTLKGFGKKVLDEDIVAIRRAWDKIEEKNKGFMMSAEATTKGDIFGDANKFFRQEIHASNPEYSRYLNDFHRTKTLSDVLGATIDRRTGQLAGGPIRQGLENVARTVAGVGGSIVGGIPGAVLGSLGTEALIRGVRAATGAGAKLTAAKKLSKLGKNGVDIDRNMNRDVLRSDGPVIRQGVEPKISSSKKLGTNAEKKAIEKPEPLKPKDEPKRTAAIGKKPENPSVLSLAKSNKGFIAPKKIAEDLGLSKKLPKELEGLAEEARKYKSAEEFHSAITKVPDIKEGNYVTAILGGKPTLVQVSKIRGDGNIQVKLEVGMMQDYLTIDKSDIVGNARMAQSLPETLNISEIKTSEQEAVRNAFKEGKIDAAGFKQKLSDISRKYEDKAGILREEIRKIWETTNKK